MLVAPRIDQQPWVDVVADEWASEQLPQRCPSSGSER